MTDTTTQQPICRFPDCYEPVHAEHVCLDHYRQFHGDTAPAAAQEPRDAAPAMPTGRLRLAPLFAIVGRFPDGSISAVYGVYGGGELAENAAVMLKALGIPNAMEIVPFYEVTP